MNKLAVTPLHTEDFHSRVTMADGVITLTLKGRARPANRRSLGEMLDEIHEHVRRLDVSRVVVDVTDLEFMNSSCFKSIVSWLTNRAAGDGAIQGPLRLQPQPPLAAPQPPRAAQLRADDRHGRDVRRDRPPVTSDDAPRSR